MNEVAKLQIYDDVNEYCERYNIPVENLMNILEDQKVLPMIRGKATEYIAAIVLKNILKGRSWQVQKLNLNAQPGMYDEYISITHSKTGFRLKVEAKNAVRGSFRIGTPKTKIKVPHFKVKCHRSRSNISLRDTTNDRYLAEDFDLIVCNVANAIFPGKTLSDKLEVLHNSEAIERLKRHYDVTTDKELVRHSYDDWRCCFPRSIAQDDKSIPRTPYVKMIDDENWFSLKDLEPKLLPELELIRKR